MNANNEDGDAGDHQEDNNKDNSIHMPPNSVHSSHYRVHNDSLMFSIHGGLEQYTSAKLYRKSELNAVTSYNGLHWMNIKVFGSMPPDPPLDANPVSVISSSPQFCKELLLLLSLTI
jgi:hypothetical protein